MSIDYFVFFSLFVSPSCYSYCLINTVKGEGREFNLNNIEKEGSGKEALEI